MARPPRYPFPDTLGCLGVGEVTHLDLPRQGDWRIPLDAYRRAKRWGWTIETKTVRGDTGRLLLWVRRLS